MEFEEVEQKSKKKGKNKQN